MPEAMYVRRVPLTDLHEDPANCVTHPSRSVEAIKASLLTFRQVEPLVVQKGTGKVVAGNGRLVAMRELGWEHCDVVELDLTNTQAAALNIALNRVSEHRLWDDAALASTMAALKTEGFDLPVLGWDDADVAKILAGQEWRVPGADDEKPKPVVEDESPEPPKQAFTRPGDLWMLDSGKGTPHRVLCGDSTKREDVERVMKGEKADGIFTSPPYAQQRESTYGGIESIKYVEWWQAVQNWARESLAPCASLFVNIRAHAKDGERNLYVFDLILAMCRTWGWKFIDDLCWVDSRNGLPGSWPNRFKDAWEPVLHFARDVKIRFFPNAVATQSDSAFSYSPDTKRGVGRNGMKTGDPGGGYHAGTALPSNVLFIPAGSDCPEHPAGFPVRLPGFFIQAYSAEGGIWLDPFLGSGTTLIAAEQLGRRCFGLEIYPQYVDVICRRWAKLTGKTPIRETDGAPFPVEAMPSPPPSTETA